MQTLANGSGAVSVFQPLGYQSGDCGYCKDEHSSQRTPKSRASYYAKVKVLTTEHYQDLVDRGWRRSGSLIYKPDNRRSCCPHWTIRLPVTQFKPSRDQRQTVNRWNRHVLGENYSKEAAKLHSKSKVEKARQRNTFDLLTAVHEAEYGRRPDPPPTPAHQYEVTLEPDTFTEEKFLLYETYQCNVHHEEPSEVSRNGFKRFLCSSPLPRTARANNGIEQKLGSYHQCYRLDGRLIAMSILDLLPHCVSGVYFIYHADFEKWSFGKLSALREAALALEGGYQYYYMGYYIHSCVKMRYKGDYKPQYLLDLESMTWDPLDGELRQLLDRRKYISMSSERRAGHGFGNEGSPQAIESDEDIINLAKPREATEAILEGLSLFDLHIPGVMTAEEVEEQINVGEVGIQVRGMQAKAKHLVDFEQRSLREGGSIKGVIGEFAACVGPDVTREMVVSFD